MSNKVPGDTYVIRLDRMNIKASEHWFLKLVEHRNSREVEKEGRQVPIIPY